MRVLHLFSNHKWTGPAEPAVNLAAALRDRGLDVRFACTPTGAHRPEYVGGHARARGLEPVVDFSLPKSRGIDANLFDILRLRKYLAANPVDIIHCHMQNDHSVGVGAAGGIPVVRSSYYGDGIRRLYLRTRYCLGRTEHLIVPSQIALDHDCKRYRYPAERATVIQGAIDTDRFDPERVTRDVRDDLEIPANAFVFGIVARMQRHRLFDVLLDAFKTVAQEFDDAYLVIVGRGTNQDEVAKNPVKQLGIADRVRFPGYVSGDDYVALVNTFDIKVFMVPGTDGTCRAVRESMAMNKPAIVNRVGMLPELIAEGETGFVFDGTRESLVVQMRAALRDRDATRAMGTAAGTIAHSEFRVDHQAERVHAIYDSVLAAR